MIRSFLCDDTKALFDDKFVSRFQANERVARRSFRTYTPRSDSTIFACRLGIGWKRFAAIEPANTASKSMTNGECVSSGSKAKRET